MSQLAGRKLPQASPGNTDFTFATVENSDHLGNGALHTMVTGNGNKTHMIVDGDIIYMGEAYPGTADGSAGWRITKQEDLSAGAGTDIEVTHAYLPAAVYRGSFATLAALKTAIAIGDPGNSAFVVANGHTYYWDYVTTNDWADTGSADAIPSGPAKYSGFDHIFTDYADLLYA